MQVRALFCKSNSIVSKAIMKATGEPVSHVALLVDKHWVVHSNLRGVHVQYYTHFLQSYDVVACTFVLETSLPVQKALTSKSFKGYDLFALAWLGLRYLLKMLFGWRIPKANLWQVTGMYLCTEWVSYVLEGEEDSTTTPFQLLRRYQDKLLRERE